MPVDLTKTLVIKDADAAFLEDLQGNILKGHGRENTVNMFLHFDSSNAEEAKQFARDVANKVTSSKKQLDDTARFKATRESGDVFVAFFMTFKGYGALGVEAAKIPEDAAFKDGLQEKVEKLKDPPVWEWDEHFQKDIHALILIGDDKTERIDKMRDAILALKPDSVTVLGEEIGLAMRNKNGDGIEHFGYVDGRSQPLLLQEDVSEETDTTDGTNVWEPAFPLKQALVECRGGTPGVSFGSYFVFRKLEQNVSGFKAAEKKIAKQLELPKKDFELAGAMLVGRFEDGTPVVLQKGDGADNPVPNNFNYDSDKKGLKCPFHAHIRKTNPRGESVGIISAAVAANGDTPAKPPVPDLEDERSRIMARRGITYGTRVWEHDMANTVLDEEHLPSEGVGLLFMAYQSDLARQFEFTQSSWANNEGFVKFNKETKEPLTGIDPIIGQGNATISLKQTRKWGESVIEDVDFQGFVTMKGGEYFFAPCISFLKNI